jgi:hypothetical protein
MADLLDSTEQETILRTLADWQRDFVAGRLRERGFRQPKLEAGERFACRVLSIEAGGSGQPPIRGGAHVTDRRVFVVGNRPVPLREWRWADVPQVSVINGWRGVRIGVDTDVILSQKPPTLATAISWLKLQGAHALAHDRLDDWFQELPAWLAGDPDNSSADDGDSPTR